MLLKIILISIVEGITEFLPISSTGHMLITQRLLDIKDSEEFTAFLIIVQAGAILAVVTVFWDRFLLWLQAWLSFIRNNKAQASMQEARRESLGILLAVVPFAIAGYLLKDHLDLLFSTRVVALALITGGILLGLVDYLSNRISLPCSCQERDFTLKMALLLGLGQCLALWPGFSRSAAIIITGRLTGFSQNRAAELSFLIGLPTLVGAASYEALHSARALMSPEWLTYLAVGITVAWVFAYLFVKWFINYLRKHSLMVFAVYRVAIGIAILAFMRS